jgi:hypothetical protein
MEQIALESDLMKRCLTVNAARTKEHWRTSSGYTCTSSSSFRDLAFMIHFIPFLKSSFKILICLGQAIDEPDQVFGPGKKVGDIE